MLGAIGADLAALNDEMRAAGAWVFAGGLHAPSTATVVRAADGEIVITDGPFIEGKEHLGGFTIVEAADLDAALEWGAPLRQATTGCRSRCGRSGRRDGS